MTTEYLVRKIETCADCEGEGVVGNQDWQEINQANNKWMQEHTEGRFTDEALADWERRIREKWPHSKPPPEEESCVECEGEGKIERWITLQQALAELGIWQPPNWVEIIEPEELEDLPF